jgi:hypothetical protein
VTAVARAVTNGWVSWGAYNVGLLSFDHSLFDGTDVFGVSPLDATFTGTYDDVSKMLDQIRVTRGRSNNLDVVLAGTANVDLRDPSGNFNPDNPSGPLYGQLEDRLHPIKLVDTFAGTTYGLFYGWVRRFHWEPQGRRGITRLECVDLFYWLERANPVIASTGPTTTGAAIGKILDSVGATDAGMRDLDTGDTIPDFSANGTNTALELIQGLLDAERGVFFIAGTGKATYRSRLSRLTKVSATTITDKMSNAEPGVDWDQTYTRVTVQRVDAAGTLLYTTTSTDAATVAKVGYNDLPTIQTTYLNSNAQADTLAAWILSQNLSPKPPLRDFTIDNREAAQLTQLLARELVDRITVNAARGGTSGDFHIDSISLAIDGTTGGHTMAWLLSKASTMNPIVFDTSTFDNGFQFVY